ncbi:MAG: TlyA family RNA methyltransferase [Thermoflexales bacterium]|nr:TlyA family RNA methyltransferase [Thermoflexales bacterium]
MADKMRLDMLLVARGLAESREWAQRLIRAGEVRVNGQVVLQPAQRVDTDAQLEIEQPPKYVSRGGYKLEAALAHFGVNPSGLVCADVGSSTGGFTDCLLQHGAARVYAIDAGTHQLHWRLRNNPRVVLMERTNARYLDALPEPIDLATVDVSFISLTLILPQVFKWLREPSGRVIALIKPQFEAGREQVGKGGVVRDPQVHHAVIEALRAFVARHGWHMQAVIPSPILGADGNQEFLAFITKP